MRTVQHRRTEGEERAALLESNALNQNSLQGLVTRVIDDDHEHLRQELLIMVMEVTAQCTVMADCVAKAEEFIREEAAGHLHHSALMAESLQDLRASSGILNARLKGWQGNVEAFRSGNPEVGLVKFLT